MDDDVEEWVKVSNNAFGAFIHVSLQSGIWSAVIKTGPMVVASIMIQAIFSEELISQHIAAVEKHSDGSHKLPNMVNQICWVPVKLQMSAVIIFITLMFGNIPGMFVAGRIALSSTHHKGGDGVDVGEMDGSENHDLETSVPLAHVPFVTRLVIFVCAVLSEVLSWGAIMLAGILFAVTAKDVDLVIRSTVSVMFVLNIDEIVFEACCPDGIKEDVEETEYRLPPVKALVLKSKRLEHLISHYYGVYVHLNLLIACSATIVFVLRILYLNCEQHPIWQSEHVKGLAPWPGGLPEAPFPN